MRSCPQPVGASSPKIPELAQHPVERRGVAPSGSRAASASASSSSSDVADGDVGQGAALGGRITAARRSVSVPARGWADRGSARSMRAQPGEPVRVAGPGQVAGQSAACRRRRGTSQLSDGPDEVGADRDQQRTRQLRRAATRALGRAPAASRLGGSGASPRRRRRRRWPASAAARCRPAGRPASPAAARSPRTTLCSWLPALSEHERRRREPAPAPSPRSSSVAGQSAAPGAAETGRAPTRRCRPRHRSSDAAGQRAGRVRRRRGRSRRSLPNSTSSVSGR